MQKNWFAIFAFLMIVFSCNSNDTKAKVENANYEMNKSALFKKEAKDPAMFLRVSGDSRKNIVGQTVVKGTITNNATVAIYKDVDLKLSFFSRTKALLETDKETIYVIVDPGESRGFKTKYFAPKGTDSVALQVLGANVITK